MTKQSEICLVKGSNVMAICLMAVIISLTACFKKDIRISLPPKTGSSVMQVRMGTTYQNCFFVNLEKNSIVQQALITDWDLRFDATAKGSAVLINSGNQSTRIIAANTTIMDSGLNVPPLNITWGFDAPNQLVDSAFLNDWWLPNNTSNNQVYIIRQGESATTMKYYKIKMISVDANKYVMQYDTMTGKNPKTITLPKNTSKNFVYFSFVNGGRMIDWEPAKTNWDICFMPYHHPFYTETPFLYYPVTGVLANSFNTQTAGDTSINNSFASFTIDKIAQYTFNTNANTIGYNWKKPDANFNYITYSDYLYLIKNQNGAIFKLHFLDFYYQGIEKGAPRFEFERMQ
jgi:HmuY protein